MVKVGKFQRRGLGIQVRKGTGLGMPPYGFYEPVKRFWFGQLETKVFDAATADAINLRAATWGFTRIDWAQVWPLKYGTAKKHIGAGFGAGVGTNMQWASFHYSATQRSYPCTLYAGASLDATTGVPILGMVFGG